MKFALTAAALVCAALFSAPPSTAFAGETLKVVLAGGGPSTANNQAAIESNVRYMERILPPEAISSVLFADGHKQSQVVACYDQNNNIYYRVSMLPRIDGADRMIPLQSAIEHLYSSDAEAADSRALLYFTGHGSPDASSNFENNNYDMWAGEHLTVSGLSADIALLPKSVPVTLIMVQCFSGAFGNVIFQGGDPKNDLDDRDICGFFASIPTRVAAGCTPELNEAYYHDFTSYFIAALTGVDRLNRPVTGADYNHDGHVGMNEAFTYALIHDESIDTPVCTSDTFLRRYTTLTDVQISGTPYSSIYSWASPAQQAALDGLSKLLNANGEQRFAALLKAFGGINSGSWDMRDTYTIRFVRLAKSVILGHTLETTGTPEIKQRYHQLLQSESRELIPRAF